MKVVLAITFLCAAIIYANEEQAQKLTTLDPDISYLTTNGYWETDGKSGQYRIIEITQGFDLRRSTIYLQWIHIDGDNAEITITHSISIPEVNTEMWCFFEKALYDFEKKSFTLYYQKRGDGSQPSEIENKVHTAILKPTELGKYKLTQEK